MRSMTGYGEGAAVGARYRLRVTMRSLNHRYLDLSIRLPEEHRARERLVEEVVRGRVRRGRIEVRVAIEDRGEPAVRVTVHADVARSLCRQLEPLREEGLLDQRVTPGDLLRLPGAVAVDRDPPDWDEDASRLLASALEEALDQMIEGRDNEGAKLRRRLEERLDAIGSLLAEMIERWRTIRSATRDGLRARLDALLGDSRLPEERLAQEAALLVERADVSEELDRLAAHVQHFREVMGGEGSLGKRLDFLSQEILRELNTTSSKCRDVEMVRKVVHGKLLCEQLREQVQNIE